MNAETLKEAIRRELPGFIKADPEFRAYLLDLMRPEFASRAETDDRFYALLNELRRDREAQTAKWQEWRQEWKTYREAQESKWAEQNRKWEANQAELLRLHEEIMAQNDKLDRSIGGLGARWGLKSESAFRNALAGILEKHFGVEVLNVSEYDDQGVVFGRPDQIELDIIVKNGLLLICELKSSIDKAGMYSFERKARFYEERHQRKADRLIVISPMIDPRALPVAQRLGIETFSDSQNLVWQETGRLRPQPNLANLPPADRSDK